MVERCRVCGTRYNLEEHHLKPISEGGTDAPENKVYLCSDCHKMLGKKGYAKPGQKGQNRSNTGTFYLGNAYKDAWQEFRAMAVRDGTTASKRILNFIVDYVTTHGPGNPQRPLTAYAPGHPDEEEMRRTELLKVYLDRSQVTGGEVTYGRIVEDLKAQGVLPAQRVAIARSLARDLTELGVRVMF